MASGNLLLGYGRNSIGDITLYRSGGMQRARARNRNPHNPRSASQAVQRMVLATAAKMASAYEPIVNHSWEGKEVGATSVQYFRKLAMASLRAGALAAINGDSSAPVADFVLKGAPTIGMIEGLKISEGRLPMIGPISLPDDILLVNLPTGISTITDQQTYEAALAEIGLEPGDQLTVVYQGINLGVQVAAFGPEGHIEKDYAQVVRYCRVTFKAACPTLDSTANLIVSKKWNPIFVESAEGVWPDIDATGTTLSFDLNLITGYSPYSATLIRSKKVEGKTYYSPAYMVVSAETLDENDAPATYPSYMDTDETVTIGDQLYLRNAVAAPFVQGE